METNYVMQGRIESKREEFQIHRFKHCFLKKSYHVLVPAESTWFKCKQFKAFFFYRGA